MEKQKSYGPDKLRWEEAEAEEKIRLKQYVSLHSKERHNNFFLVNKYLVVVWNIQQVSLSQSKNTRKKFCFGWMKKTWCTKHSLINVKKCSLGVKCQLLIIYFCKIHEMHHVFFASSSWLLMGELFCSVLDIIIRAPLLIVFKL